MTKRSAERLQFLHDVMCHALEGGVGYWSAADEITMHEDEDLWYRSYTLYCTDGGKEPVECGDPSKDAVCQGHRVDPEVVARGLDLATRAGKDDKTIGWHYSQRDHVIRAARENDAVDVDSGDADCIVQLGIFGEVIYG